MNNLDRLLATAPILEALLSLPAAPDAFLVGGAIRNAFLNRPVTDFDFATPFDPTDLARSFAKGCGGRWFFLDRGRNQCRVTWREAAGSILTFDFAPFRAADLEADLRDRDFTVNAIAINLGDRRFHDPMQGREALVKKELRLCADYAFRDDPLRILRLARLAATLDFTIEAKTGQQAAAEAALLARVPAERRGDELVHMVNDNSVGRGLELLSLLGALPYAFGPGRQSAPAFIQKTAEGLGLLDTFCGWLEGHKPRMTRLLLQPVGRSLHRLGRLRLALILAAAGHDPVAVDTLLALGQETVRALQWLCPLHRSCPSPPPKAELGQRALARWADLQPFPVDRLLLSAALAPTLPARVEILAALKAYLELSTRDRIPDLVDGHWMASCLSLKPGPQLGELLAKLRLAELEGEVRSPDEARKFLILLKEKTIDKKNGAAL